MGSCFSSKAENDQGPVETDPLVVSTGSSTAGATKRVPISVLDNDETRPPSSGGARPVTASFALASSHPPPDFTTPPVATSVFSSLNRQKTFNLEPPNFPVQQLQESFNNIYKLYTEAAFANREKIDECVKLFKQILGVHPQLHMRECFRAWKEKIVEPVFKITLTDNQDLVKEIIVKAERGNIPQEIWSAQKFIRELLNGCHLFLSQHLFFQNSIEESFIKIRQTLKNLSSITRSDASLYSQRERIKEEAERLYDQYQNVIGIMSRFEEEIKQLMLEIFDSVSVLNN